MITHLVAKDFQKHEHLDLDFSKGGLTLICGENWAGKTTILRAILYGLFGPSGMPGGAKAAQRKGCPTKPVVEVQFKLGHNYRVRRSASVTRLWRGEEMIANGTRPVNDSIRELLGMDAQTFAILKVAPQEEAGVILTLGSEKLGGLINQITGVTLVDTVIEKASHEGSVARSMRAQTETEDPVPLKEQVVVLVRDLKNHYTAVEGLQLHLAGQDDKIERKGKVFRDFFERWNKKALALQEKHMLEGKLGGLKDQLIRVSSYEHMPDRVMLRRQVDTLQSGYDGEVSRGTQRKETGNRVIALREQKSELEKKIEEHVEEFVNGVPLPQEQEKARRLQNEAYARALAAFNDAKQLTKLVDDSVCPTCRRPFEEADPVVLGKRLEKAVEYSAKCSKSYEEHSAKVNEGDRMIALWGQHLERARVLDEVTEAHDKLVKEMLEIPQLDDGNFTQLKDALHEAREELQIAEIKYASNLRAQEQLANLSAAVTETETKLAARIKDEDPVTEEDVAEQRRLLEEMRAEHQRLQVQHERDQGRYREMYARYEALNARYRAAVDAEAKLGKLKRRSDLCAKLAKYLRTNRDRFTKEVWEALLVSASSFAQLATEGKIQSVSRTGNGTFEYVEEGHKMSVEAASGVQRAILGVGVRLAIAEALRSPVDFLLLDEVTAGATDEVSLSMARTLGHAQQQVLMVTHRHSDAAAASAVIQI